MGRVADYMTPAATLPSDGTKGALVRPRVAPDVGGPRSSPCAQDGVYDISALAPTVRDLCEAADPAAIVRTGKGERIGALDDILANTPEDARDPGKPWLLAPIDLQAIKAAGVTFPLSMLERVIEEQARGCAARRPRRSARASRPSSAATSRKLVPGSTQAAELKRVLIEQGAWSQYLEVGIGPDAEIFTKAQPMAAVGHGMEAGLHPISTWNNPEPEVVLVVNSKGAIVGATLGNDVNLRDVEGRSALLLVQGQGQQRVHRHRPLHPPVRRRLHARHRAPHRGEPEGRRRGRLRRSRAARRWPRSRAIQPTSSSRCSGRHHQYPDGAVLYLGTMFAPVKDRGAKGQGFTHKPGDITTIAAPELGTLANRMTLSTEAPPWEFGTGALMRNLAHRGLL